ncbi:hypothetical protein BH11ARM2_BH11ARM2_34070 [soil metagenome]
MKAKFWSVSLQLLVLSALLGGIAVCAYLEWVRVAGIYLPCRTAVCGRLETDPLNSLPFVKVSTAGLTAYLVLLLGTLFAFSGRRRALLWARVLSSFCFIASLGLVFYVMKRYGGPCPWCMASAVCFGAATYGLVTWEPSDFIAPKWIYFVAMVTAGAAFTVLLASQTTYAADEQAASSLSSATACPKGCELTEERPRYVAIVDFGCSSCRQLIRALASNQVPFGLRIAPPHDAYAHACAELFYRAKDASVRRRVVGKLLNETTFVDEAIWKLTSTMMKSELYEASPDSRWQEDTDVYSRLRVQATPALLILDGKKVRLASTAETANLVHSR